MAHVFGDLLRQNFRCGRMPNSRANAVRARGNALHCLKNRRRTAYSARELYQNDPRLFFYKKQNKKQKKTEMRILS